jgi:biopolymer transport protein ExbB/TolQ
VRWPRRWLTALAVSRLTRRKSKLFRAARDQRSLEQSARSADDLADAKRPLNGGRQAVHRYDRERVKRASGPTTDVEGARERLKRREECF